MKSPISRNAYILGFLFTLFFILSTAAQVGIGTTDPKTTLDVNGAISLKEGAPLSLNNGVNNNISLGTTPYSFYRITGPTAAFSISGIVPLTGADGQIVTLENTTSNTMTIAHDATSTAANRIYCPGAKDFVLVEQYATVTLIYNATQTKWIIKNYTDNRYGDNIQSSVGTTDTSIYASIDTAPFATMNSMTITFTPKHSTVYVNFSSSGFVSPLINGTTLTTNQTGVYFRLQNGATTLGHISSAATDYDIDDMSGEGVLTAWNAHFTMFPITVTPGVSTTISIEWRADTFLGNLFPSTVNPIVYCNPATDTFSHRSLTIFD